MDLVHGLSCRRKLHADRTRVVGKLVPRIATANVQLARSWSRKSYFGPQFDWLGQAVLIEYDTHEPSGTVLCSVSVDEF